MEIKDGYNSKKLGIRLERFDNSRTAGLWIEFENEPRKETLNIITLDELLDLQEEIKQAIKNIIN